MVIIAAVIGGFDDIGWAVLLTMRKADFGNSLVAGLVIVIFAMLIDRLSGKLAETRPAYSARITWVILALTVVCALVAALPAGLECDQPAGGSPNGRTARSGASLPPMGRC